VEKSFMTSSMSRRVFAWIARWIPKEMMRPMNREKAIRVFEHLDEHDYDVAISATTQDKMHPRKWVNVRVTIRPVNSETMKAFEELIAPLEIKYRADPLTSVFAQSVTFTLEDA
jgi:hypothetical protein